MNGLWKIFLWDKKEKISIRYTILVLKRYMWVETSRLIKKAHTTSHFWANGNKQMMIGLPLMIFYLRTQTNLKKISTSPIKEIFLVRFFYQERLPPQETRISWEIIKSSQLRGKRSMSLSSKTFWRTMKIKMTRLLVLYLTVLILSLGS